MYIMKSKSGKYYEVEGGIYNMDNIGVETGVYYERENGCRDEYCIDKIDGYERAMLTCGDVPVCWLAQSEGYYEGRKNRVKAVIDLCRRFADCGITSTVDLLDAFSYEQGENFAIGCEVPVLQEVAKSDVLSFAQSAEAGA